MIKEKVPNRRVRKPKEFNVTTWQYKGRKHNIYQHITQTHLILFDMGFYLDIDPSNWNATRLRRVQKQLRQYLYNYLATNDFQSDNYILIVEGSKKPVRNKTFIELKVTYPSVGNNEQNIEFCNQITDEIYLSLR